MVDAILKTVISSLVLSLLVWVLSKVVLRFVLPQELKTRLDKFESKFDDFLETYKEGAERNKSSQKALFTMQSIQFDAMKNTNGAIRELAKSVCNGNKEYAIKMCDDSDEEIKNGKGIHRNTSIGDWYDTKWLQVHDNKKNNVV